MLHILPDPVDTNRKMCNTIYMNIARNSTKELKNIFDSTWKCKD